VPGPAIPIVLAALAALALRRRGGA